MATIFLRSTDGSDANPGTVSTSPKQTLVSALTAAGAGGLVYVSDLHDWAQATNIVLASPGTSASPVRVVCVADWGNGTPTALSTGAKERATGTATLAMTGYTYAYGMTFSASGNGLADSNWDLENCNLISLATSANTVRTLAGQLRWNNVNVTQSGSVAQNQFYNLCELVWNGGTAIKNGSDDFWFGGTNGSSSVTTCFNVDFSQFGTIAKAANSGRRFIRLINCKFKAGVTFLTGLTAHGAEDIEVINGDSADTNYRYHRQNYLGTITSEIGVVRTGGSSDGNVPFSRKYVTSSASKTERPLVAATVVFHNPTAGSPITVTAEVVTDGVTLTDAEAWIEVDYHGTSGSTLGLRATDRLSDIIFGTPANQPTSTANWTTTELSSPVKQQLSTTITPTKAGAVYARICLAKPSTTMYADQLVMTTASGRQYMAADVVINEGASGGGLLLPSGMTGGFHRG